MTARRRRWALLLLLAAVLLGCGTLTTSGGEVADASTGVVASDDGTAVVSLPVGREDAAAEITIEPLDLESDGDAPGADAGDLASDVLEGLGTDPTGLDPDDLDAFELGLSGGWRVAFSEPWFEEYDTYGIGSRPVFGLTTDFWAPIPWQPRLLPLDVAPSEGDQQPQDQAESGGTPVPVPIVVRVDEEGATTVLPGTVVTPHPAGATVTAPLEGSGTVAAFGGTVAVSVTPERVRALVGEVFRTRVTMHIAEDFGGTFRNSGQAAVATGSANVRPLTASVQLDNRDGDSAELEFVCREPGLGRFGVTLDIVSVSMITFGQFPSSMFEDRGVAMRLGVVECLDPNDPRLPESVTDDLQPVFVGLPRIDDTVDPSELPTAEPQDLPRPPVEADRPPSLVGPCDGRAILDDGTVIDPSSSAGVYVVPRVGDAFYLGSVDAQVTEPRGFAGSVVLHLPPPLAAVPIGSWSGTGEGTSATGVQAWDLAGPVLPPGVRLPLEANHRDDAAGHCSASLVVAFEGGFTDSPFGPAGAAAALLGLAGVGLAGIPKRT